jgi:hypothetical protein
MLIGRLHFEGHGAYPGLGAAVPARSALLLTVESRRETNRFIEKDDPKLGSTLLEDSQQNAGKLLPYTA